MLAAVGVAIGVFAVLALARSDAVDARTGRAGLADRGRGDARVNGGEPGQTLDEMVEAQLVACRLEVSSDLVGEVEPLRDDGRYQAVLTPSMDETNRRQFRGCLEDWMIDQFQLDVIRLAEIARSG